MPSKDNLYFRHFAMVTTQTSADNIDAIADAVYNSTTLEVIGVRNFVKNLNHENDNKDEGINFPLFDTFIDDFIRNPPDKPFPVDRPEITDGEVVHGSVGYIDTLGLLTESSESCMVLLPRNTEASVDHRTLSAVSYLGERIPGSLLRRTSIADKICAERVERTSSNYPVRPFTPLSPHDSKIGQEVTGPIFIKELTHEHLSHCLSTGEDEFVAQWVERNAARQNGYEGLDEPADSLIQLTACTIEDFTVKVVDALHEAIAYAGIARSHNAIVSNMLWRMKESESKPPLRMNFDSLTSSWSVRRINTPMSIPVSAQRIWRRLDD